MTFDQWFGAVGNAEYGTFDGVAKAAWDAATKAEREACAKLLENNADGLSMLPESQTVSSIVITLRSAANLIREKGNDATPPQD